MSTIDNAISNETLGFDPNALAERYAEERDKRIRPDAEAQFVQLAHDSPFTNKYLEEDPYCEPLERALLKDEREVIVIGGGWVGMLTAARLVEAGITDVRIVESGGDFGGIDLGCTQTGADMSQETVIRSDLTYAAGMNHINFPLVEDKVWSEAAEGTGTFSLSIELFPLLKIFPLSNQHEMK